MTSGRGTVSPMPKGLVLVIEDDEWTSGLLSGAIRDAGYDVIVCNTAKAGVDMVCSREPDCIICDIDLPDQDGYWVARNVRTQPSRVSVTPFLFLSALDDQEARLEGFHVGADAYMTKPFRVDEVVAQVGALVQMASRLRKRRDSLVSVPPSSASTETTAIQGDLSQMSIATVLTVLELERRTGTVEVVSKKRKVQLDVAMGLIVNGSIGGTKTDAITILRSILGWKVGRFSFTPQPDRPPTGDAQPIGHLLLEAVRLEDESVHNGEPARSSRRVPSARLSAPSLGGPPSRQADLGPPSSRAFAPRPAPAAEEKQQAAPDRPAYYDDWSDFGLDEPARAAAPPPASTPDGPTSGDLIPESAYGSEGLRLEDELTEVSEDQLDELDEEAGLDDQNLLEEDLASERPDALLQRPPPRRSGAMPPLRPGAAAGLGRAGGPPQRLTPMPRTAGLPGPPPRQNAMTRTTMGLPGPPPRTAAGTNRLPGPPPQKPLAQRPSGEFVRPAVAPQPPPRQPIRSTPPPLPNAGSAQPRTGPVPTPPGARATDPGTGPIPRTPAAPPLPRAPQGTNPGLGDSGVRPAPPPLPPRQTPTSPRTPTSPGIDEKKR